MHGRIWNWSPRQCAELEQAVDLDSMPEALLPCLRCIHRRGTLARHQANRDVFKIALDGVGDMVQEVNGLLCRHEDLGLGS